MSFLGGCFLLSSIFFQRLAILLVTCFLAFALLPFEFILELLLDLCAGLGIPDFLTAPFCNLDSFFKLKLEGDGCIFLTGSLLSALVDRL